MYFISPNISLYPARRIFLNGTFALTYDMKLYGPQHLKLLKAEYSTKQHWLPYYFEFSPLISDIEVQAQDIKTFNVSMNVDLNKNWVFFALWLKPLIPTPCIDLTSFTLWYKFCRGANTSLVIFPEVEAASDKASESRKKANCIPNAEATTSAEDLFVSCSENGVPTYHGRCQCKAGFELNENSCKRK